MSSLLSSRSGLLLFGGPLQHTRDTNTNFLCFSSWSIVVGRNSRRDEAQDRLRVRSYDESGVCFLVNISELHSLLCGEALKEETTRRERGDVEGKKSNIKWCRRKNFFNFYVNHQHHISARFSSVLIVARLFSFFFIHQHISSFDSKIKTFVIDVWKLISILHLRILFVNIAQYSLFSTHHRCSSHQHVLIDSRQHWDISSHVSRALDVDESSFCGSCVLLVSFFRLYIHSWTSDVCFLFCERAANYKVVENWAFRACRNSSASIEDVLSLDA